MHIPFFLTDISNICGRGRLPFHLLPSDVLPLPTEIWEQTIDWICVEKWETSIPYPTTRTLYRCALVCRAWRDRSRMHLWSHVALKARDIPKLQTVLRSGLGFPSSFIKRLSICEEGNWPISALLVSWKWENLTYLQFIILDLSRQHVLCARATLPWTVRVLHIHQLYKGTVSRLLRFLNCFHSLENLYMFIGHQTELESNGEVLPPPKTKHNRSLTSLDIGITPGVNKLIHWYLREGVFLHTLRNLIVKLHLVPEGPDFQVYCDGLKALLDHCTDTLEHLGIALGYEKKMDEFVDICMLCYLTARSTYEANESLVKPLSFPKLRKLTWSGCNITALFHFAAKQLATVSSPTKITEILFLIDLEDYEPVRETCRVIDEVLTGDNFPLLREVQLHKFVPFDLFPALESNGVLSVFRLYQK